MSITPSLPAAYYFISIRGEPAPGGQGPDFFHLLRGVCGSCSQGGLSAASLILNFTKARQKCQTKNISRSVFTFRECMKHIYFFVDKRSGLHEKSR